MGGTPSASKAGKLMRVPPPASALTAPAPAAAIPTMRSSIGLMRVKKNGAIIPGPANRRVFPDRTACADSPAKAPPPLYSLSHFDSPYALSSHGKDLQPRRPRTAHLPAMGGARLVRARWPRQAL